MVVNLFKAELNTGILSKTNEAITIKKNRWIDSGGISHPMKFSQPIAFENSNVYFLYLFGKDDSHHGRHISLSFWQNQKFQWLQNRHWVQQKDNIMWFINIMVAVLAIIAALK